MKSVKLFFKCLRLILEFHEPAGAVKFTVNRLTLTLLIMTKLLLCDLVLMFYASNYVTARFFIRKPYFYVTLNFLT